MNFAPRCTTRWRSFLEDGTLDENRWADFAPESALRRGRPERPGLYAAIKDKLTALARPSVLFYLSTQPSYYGEVVERLGAAGLGRSGAEGWQRIVVEKPFGHDLESARIEPAHPPGFRGSRCLSHRSLSGQRDGAEHFGVPLRQRNFRAVVEPALRESRADHGGGIDRGRRARRVLSGSRRGARHDPESSAAGDGHRRHGAVGGV